MFVERQFIDYLIKCGDDVVITREIATLAIEAWYAILKETHEKISIPAVCTGPDGEIFYSWDHGRHHLELEIIPGEPPNFFYRDRETEQYWGEDYTIGEPLPTKVIATLRLFPAY